MSSNAIKAVNVHKRYGTRPVLNGASLAVAPREIVTIIGPSGSGKSTLLRAVNHLESIDSGTIEVNGELVGYRRHGNFLRELPDREIARRRSTIGMVFQRFNLFAHKTALQNVMEAPIVVQKRSRREVHEEAHALLARVGMSGHLHAYPHQLSGGQQQRVAIARSLALRPSVLLLDEPTSALDPGLSGEVLAVIKQLAREGLTMLIVTHEMEFAREVSDRIVFFDEGRVIEDGCPADLLSASHLTRSRSFLLRGLEHVAGASGFCN